jgi:hypothetical protein
MQEVNQSVMTLVTACSEVVGSEVLTSTLQLALEAGNFFNYGARQVRPVPAACPCGCICLLQDGGGGGSGIQAPHVHAAPLLYLQDCPATLLRLQGSAIGFSFEYLPKLKSIKSANTKGVTLIHFLARCAASLPRSSSPEPMSPERDGLRGVTPALAQSHSVSVTEA